MAIGWCDIDFERKLIHLRGQVDVSWTKIVAMETAQSERFVSLTPKMERYLGREARMASRLSADDDYVFAASRLRPKSYRNVRRALAVAAKEADLGGVRAHDRRHSLVSNLLAHQAERAALAAAAAGLGY